MLDEVVLKPKVSCPECHELHSESKISAHIESHRPFNPPGPDTSICPKGCSRNLTRSEMKEHVELCDGALPLLSKTPPGLVTPPVEPPTPIMKKEEPVNWKSKKKCPICGIPLKNSKALGGHMGAHRRKPRATPAKPTAQTAVAPAPRPARKTGKRVAPKRLRSGGILPPPPAQVAPGKPSSAGKSLREAAHQKRVQGQKLIEQASELEKLADRADELL